MEAARASIVAEITGVFGAYGIAVDPRHLGLVADHMTFDGGYRPLNRAGMADFSSPCLQVLFVSLFLAAGCISQVFFVCMQGNVGSLSEAVAQVFLFVDGSRHGVVYLFCLIMVIDVGDFLMY